MDSKKIENLAVSTVTESVTTSDYLSPFISDNDKEPSWDGHVYIYKSTNNKKDQLIGRVPVQVKGTEKGDLNKIEITYPIALTDLKNYLSDGGAVYFVVYMSPLRKPLIAKGCIYH
jgi:hypothetical protein